MVQKPIYMILLRSNMKPSQSNMHFRFSAHIFLLREPLRGKLGMVYGLKLETAKSWPKS